MKRRMKQREYGILMTVGILLTVLTPVAPCRAAGWVPTGGSTSGGAPGSDSDYDFNDWWGWEWEYDSSGVSRGGDQYGCWAEGMLTYYTGMLVDIPGPASLGVWPPDGRFLSVYADYDYTKRVLEGYRYLDYKRDVYISGNVWICGEIDNAALGPNDDAYTEAWAWGLGFLGDDRFDYGYGAVIGDMQQASHGNIYYGVAGEATQDSGANPIIYNTIAGFYTVDYDFTIDVYEADWDDGLEVDANDPSAPSVLTIATELRVEVDGSASVDVSQGYTGKAASQAEATVDGWSEVDVRLHN